jgi:malonyl-CoA decarboxylase
MHAEAEIERSGKAPFLSDILDNLTQRGLNLLRRGRGLQGRTNQDLVQLSNLLLSRRGEASGVAIAEMLLSSFEAVEEPSRLAFLHALANEFGADRHRVDAAVQAYLADPSNPDRLDRLHSEAEPRRQELLRRLNLASGGTAALVQMRELLCEHMPGNPDLARVDADFAHLFSSWFNRGFLVLRRIDWTTPANILEKIIRYEAVHAIRDWYDLRRRLEPPDRRCYAFFHPQLGDEPLIFVEIALTDGIPEAIDPLLAPASNSEMHREPTTAVFYSISNTQKVLPGSPSGIF